MIHSTFSPTLPPFVPSEVEGRVAITTPMALTSTSLGANGAMRGPAR